MPIESIVAPKAPKGWRPNSDQMQRIQNNPQLRRMSLDDQYFYFNQKGSNGVEVKRGSAPPPKQTPPRGNGGPAAPLFGWVDTIMQALKGQ